jgi:hypothetical protein
VHGELIDFMHRAIDLNPRKRYRDAEQMLTVFLRLKARTLRHSKIRRLAAG